MRSARIARRESLEILDELITRGTEAFANVAKGAIENPADQRLSSLLARTIVDLERLLRLREGLARRQ